MQSANLSQRNLMKIQSLDDLLHHELKDLYSAENQLLKAIPKMAKAAEHEDLKAAFEEHLQVTERHVERLDQIAEMMDKKLSGMTCKAMKGLVEEGSDIISDVEDSDVRDAGLIGAAQRVEHYEIASYGTARTLAQQLGLDEVAELLQETLDEEKEADEKLTELAESHINAEAGDNE